MLHIYERGIEKLIKRKIILYNYIYIANKNAMDEYINIDYIIWVVLY